MLTSGAGLDDAAGRHAARVAQLLRRCLEKDPKQRLRDIGDARLVLEDAFERAAPHDGRRRRRDRAASRVVARALPWAVAGAARRRAGRCCCCCGRRGDRRPRPRRASCSPASAPTRRCRPTSARRRILSPDGTTLAFVAQQAGQTRLFVRKLDQLQAAALAGTEGAANPFFSPDGQWIAFFAGGKLKKVSVTGGAAVKLCDAPTGRGGTWTDDDTIIFTPTSAPNTTLMRVPAAGGTPAVFGTLSKVR